MEEGGRIKERKERRRRWRFVITTPTTAVQPPQRVQPVL
jgi:hypothetical protein